MTKMNSGVSMKGVALGLTSNYEITVGNVENLSSGVTIYADTDGVTPMAYDTEYLDFIDSQYGLTAPIGAKPYNAPWTGFNPNRLATSNLEHTYLFGPSIGPAAWTYYDLFRDFGIGVGNNASYLEIGVDELSIPLGPTVMGVGIENYPVVGTGYQEFYQLYYLNDGSSVMYLDGELQESSPAGTYPVYGAGDRVGIVAYRDIDNSSIINWFLNGIWQFSYDPISNFTFSQAKVNFNAATLGYTWGHTPITPPPPVPVAAKININSSPLSHESDYVNWFESRGLTGTYTIIDTPFQTGSDATYSNSDRTLQYPAGIPSFPHVGLNSTQSGTAGNGYIYEITQATGSLVADNTQLGRVGFEESSYFSADYGGGYGNYNSPDTIGVVIWVSNDGTTTTATWFVNGNRATDMDMSGLTSFQLYVEFEAYIVRPIVT